MPLGILPRRLALSDQDEAMRKENGVSGRSLRQESPARAFGMGAQAGERSKVRLLSLLVVFGYGARHKQRSSHIRSP